MSDRYELWAWVETEPDGHVGIVGATLPGLGPIPLQARLEDLALAFLPLVMQHHERTGNPVRLAHLVEEVEP